jgi:glycosyltransferase involved in cell wall biosynthesis
MKTLVVTSIYPSAMLPTAGPYNMQTFRPLLAHSELRVISPLPWWSRLRYPAELFHAPWTTVNGITSCYPTYWSVPRLGSLHAWGMYHSLAGRVANLHREFDFDVILGTWAYPDVVAAARLARKFDVPFVAKVHGSDINEVARIAPIREQIREALSTAHRVIAVSAALAAKVRDLGVPAERIYVQHNAVDGARFVIRDAHSVRSKLGLPLDRKLVGFIGRLSREKGLDLLLDAMAALMKADAPPADLVVVGGGAEATALRQHAEALGLQEKVRFVGPRLPAEVPEWISACDVICLPSRREGCPNVLIEALASGIPVVGCRVGGVPELLDDENGVLVDPENVTALANGISAALRRHWQPAALRRSVRSLDWETVAVNVYGVLKDAVAATG